MLGHQVERAIEPTAWVDRRTGESTFDGGEPEARRPDALSLEPPRIERRYPSLGRMRERKSYPLDRVVSPRDHRGRWLVSSATLRRDIVEGQLRHLTVDDGSDREQRGRAIRLA